MSGRHAAAAWWKPSPLVRSVAFALVALYLTIGGAMVGSGVIGG